MESSLDRYRVFAMVAEKGGITRAAEELYLSQPAVSQQIHALEAQLGAALFVRTSRGMRLTGEGEVLYRQVKKALESLHQGEAQVRQLLGLDAGELTIGASDMTLQFFLLPYLERFHQEHPAVRIHVTNAPTPRTLARLAEGKIDFGVISGPLEEDRGFQYKRVGQVEDVFVASRHFSGLKGKTISPGELTDYPLICLDMPTSTRKALEDYFAADHAQLSPEFELATSGLIVEFARRSMGIGCVVKNFADEALEKEQLFLLDVQPRPRPRPLYVVCDPHGPLSPAARHLLEVICRDSQAKV